MSAYLAQRGIECLLVLLTVSFVGYGLIGLMPGDPLDLMLTADPNLTSDDIARLKAIYGLDRPLLERYGLWLGRALQGDFGYSRLYAEPAWQVVATALPNTLVLMGASLALALVLALPAGILAAMHPGSRLDIGVNAIALAGISAPSFWLALVLIIVFSVMLGWFPAGGVHTVGAGGALDRLHHLVLPVVTLSVLTVGSLLRFTRAAMIEALVLPHLRTARAKGASVRHTVVRHALPSAMIAITTITALHVGALLSGALIIETVFAYPGMGRLIFEAIMGNDYNVALLALLGTTAMTLACNLAADGVYAWLDPRIRYAG